ncbi:inner centromere protein B-like isoform X2 [Dysidea avara]|uniref:inner centromere protein B-like isoform X2 n=1 Tax=Dysidea avara TaxID=196820 RepID=UPI003319C6D0
MYDYSNDSPVLSVIARGRGLLEGGVELDCIDTGTAFSISGKPFLESTPTGSGRSCKPLRTRKLALPKTYVTRRGAMVLFTAPEDMVVGQACKISEREATPKQHYQMPEEVLARLSTTKTLKQDVLDYDVTKQYHDEASDMELITQPGHFTNVYLDSLQRSTRRSKMEMQDCEIEDIEVAVDMTRDVVMVDEDKLPTDGRDSGIGQSAASSSIPSVVVDSSSEATSRVQSGLSKLHNEDSSVATPATATNDIMNLLKTQITNTAASRDKTSKTKKSKPTLTKPPTSKSPSKKPDISDSRKKTPKKTTKKAPTQKRKSSTTDKNKGTVLQAVELSDEVTKSMNNDTKTDQYSEPVSFLQQQDKVSTSPHKMREASANADRRRAMVEQKRLEKKRLEEERLLKEKENQLLQEQIERQKLELKQQQELMEGLNNDSHQDGQQFKYVTPGQVAQLGELERLQVRQGGLELSADDEALVNKETKSQDELQEMIRRAKELEATYAIEQEEKERRMRIKEEEERKRREKELIAEEARRREMENDLRRHLEEEQKKREEHNRRMNMDLLSFRIGQGISRPWTYSYFQYVPVKDTSKKSTKKKVRTKRK